MSLKFPVIKQKLLILVVSKIYNRKYWKNQKYNTYRFLHLVLYNVNSSSSLLSRIYPKTKQHPSYYTILIFKKFLYNFFLNINVLSCSKQIIEYYLKIAVSVNSTEKFLIKEYKNSLFSAEAYYVFRSDTNEQFWYWHRSANKIFQLSSH